MKSWFLRNNHSISLSQGPRVSLPRQRSMALQIIFPTQSNPPTPPPKVRHHYHSPHWFSPIFISDHSLAHQALASHTRRHFRQSTLAFFHCRDLHQHTISSAAYGQTWRVLRRNITTQILSLSRIESYSPACKWVSNILKNRLAVESGIGGEPVRLVDHFRYAMFCLSATMCFGDKLDEDRIREIDGLERELQSFGDFQCTQRMVEYHQGNHGDNQFNLSYVDSLLELQLLEEKWGLTESEMPQHQHLDIHQILVEQTWLSRRTTPLTISLTRLTRMASRSPRGTAILPPKGWIPSS
ncbi:hypothetical protein V6N13_054413 [Hibiscus sabdariffa]